jgi:cell shape-determining protein MreD
MKPLTYLLLGVALGFFQGSMEVAWSIGGPAPDLLLLYVLYLGLQRQTNVALLVAFLGGLMQGAVDYDVQPLGIQCLCKLAAAYLPEWAHYVLVSENRMTGLILVAVATLFQQIFLLSIIQTFEPGGVWGKTAILQTLGLLVWNLALWAVVVVRLLPQPQKEVGP